MLFRSTQFQVTLLEYALEQQHRATPSEGTDALRLGQIQQRKSIGTTQTFKCTLNAMTVGIRLDHGPYAGIRRVVPGPVQVVYQRLGVDGGLYRTGHGQAIRSCCPNSDTAGRAITPQRLETYNKTHSAGLASAALPDQ